LYHLDVLVAVASGVFCDLQSRLEQIKGPIFLTFLEGLKINELSDNFFKRSIRSVVEEVFPL